MVALPGILRCHGDPDVVISVDGNEILHQKDGNESLLKMGRLPFINWVCLKIG